MFAAQRTEKIKEILQIQKTVDIVSLCSMFNVSDATIRKDLEKLDADGFLRKTHGGAILLEQSNILPHEFEIANPLLKEEIALMAATLVENDETIFIGPGSTCFYLAQKLTNHQNLKIITNNVNVMNYLLTYPINLFFIGGEILYNKGLSFSFGPKTASIIRDIYVNKSFLSFDGVDVLAGYTINEYSQVELISQIVHSSRQNIALVDYTKFNRIGMYKVGDISFCSCVVSNAKLDDLYKEHYYDKNIKLLVPFEH